MLSKLLLFFRTPIVELSDTLFIDLKLIAIINYFKRVVIEEDLFLGVSALNTVSSLLQEYILVFIKT